MPPVAAASHMPPPPATSGPLPPPLPNGPRQSGPAQLPSTGGGGLLDRLRASKLPIGAIAGGLIGGLAGFFLLGPIAGVAGAAIGAFAGHKLLR